jgi:uncharacterized OB-fold protein
MSTKFETADTPLPDVTDRELAGYWEGTAANELRVQCCAKCAALRFPPRAACGECQSLEYQWKAVPQQGELFSWTVVAQTSLQGYADLVPYAVAVVQLDGVPVRMLGYVDADPATLVAGQRLQARFIRKSDQVTLPIWQRLTSESSAA